MIHLFVFQILFHYKLLPDTERVPCVSNGSVRSRRGRGGGCGRGRGCAGSLCLKHVSLCVLKLHGKDFPGGPGAKTPGFQCRNPGSIPGQGTRYKTPGFQCRDPGSIPGQGTRYKTPGFQCRDPGSIPGQGTRSHVTQPRPSTAKYINKH